MNLLKKSILIPAIVTTCVFGMDTGDMDRYDLTYVERTGESELTIFRGFSDNDINISQLLEGAELQKREAIDKIIEQHLKDPNTYKFSDILFYMLTTDRKQYLSTDPESRFISYKLTEQRKDITNELLGIMPRDFIEEKVKELKDFLQHYPTSYNFIESFEKYAYEVYESKQKANMEELKDPRYATMQKYGDSIKAELKDNYTKLVLLMELIEARHNIKA